MNLIGVPKSAVDATVVTEDLTKVYGLGDVMAEQLAGVGIDSYEALANADLETLRKAIEADGTVAQQSVNEETWAAQARFLADGDFDGLDEYVEGLREADGNTVDTGDNEPEAVEPPPAAESSAEDATDGDDAPTA